MEKMIKLSNDFNILEDYNKEIVGLYIANLRSFQFQFQDRDLCEVKELRDYQSRGVKSIEVTEISISETTYKRLLTELEATYKNYVEEQEVCVKRNTMLKGVLSNVRKGNK